MSVAGVFTAFMAIFLGAISEAALVAMPDVGKLDEIAVGSRRASQASLTSDDTACEAASKTSAQRPQRTQPLETLSWSGTILKTVSQAGQRVLRLMLADIVGANLEARSHQAVSFTAELSSISNHLRYLKLPIDSRARRRL